MQRDKKPATGRPDKVLKIQETVQVSLKDKDGKEEFCNNAFIRAVTKEFGGLPENKTVEEIVAAIKPEDVAVKVKEKE